MKIVLEGGTEGRFACREGCRLRGETGFAVQFEPGNCVVIRFATQAGGLNARAGAVDKGLAVTASGPEGRSRQTAGSVPRAPGCNAAKSKAQESLMHEILIAVSCLLMVLAPCVVVLITNIDLDQDR